MITPEVRAYMAELGRKGAKVRLERLTPQRRKEIAIMGGKATLGKRKNKKPL